MDISSGNILALVFRRVVREDIGEFSLDSNMLRVLMELDGLAKEWFYYDTDERQWPWHQKK